MNISQGHIFSISSLLLTVSVDRVDVGQYYTKAAESRDYVNHCMHRTRSVDCDIQSLPTLLSGDE
jgi:hypothetical protein